MEKNESLIDRVMDLEGVEYLTDERVNKVFDAIKNKVKELDNN